jgi:Na+/H+-dicarboxylate symporter
MIRQISIWMIAGIALGALCGYFIPQVSLALSFIGQLFLGGLKLLVIPLIITGTIAGINAFGDMRRAGRFSGQVLLYFLGSLAVAAIVGVTMALIIGPGRGFAGSAMPVAVGGWNSVGEALGSLMPGNLIQAVSEGKYLGVVLLALFLGGMLTAMGVKGRSAVTLFKNIHEGLLRVLTLLLTVAPLGLFSLIGASVAEGSTGMAATSAVAGSYLLTVTLALLIHGFLLLPLVVWLMGKRSPFEFYRNMMPAFFTAFGTSSSMATFPVTYRCLSVKCQIDERATAMVLPLGSVINLQGTVICMIVATLFAAGVSGVSFGPLEVVGVAALAILLSIGAAGIPSATLLIAPVMLAVIGLSGETIGVAFAVVIALDWLVDRIRAMVNVGGDAAGAAVLAESFELKTARRTGRERRPSRPARGGRPTGRDRGPSSSGGRSTGRRPERTPRPAESDRSRGRKPVEESGENTSRGRGGRTRSPRQEQTPFQMKTPSTPPLGAETGTAPSRRPASEAKAESDSRRSQSERRRSPRTADSSTSERRGRSRTRTPADKPSEPRARTQQPSKPAPRRRPEPSRPAQAEPKPSTPEVVTKEIKETKETNGTSETSGRLNASTVARELAKVSAQLREPEETKSIDRPMDESKPPVAEKPPVVADEPKAEAPAPVESKPEPAKEEPAPTFGRTRRYKGAAVRKDKAELTKPDTPKPEKKAEPAPAPTPEPVVEPAVVVEPKVEAPKVEAPKVEAPKVEAPTQQEEVKPAEEKSEKTEKTEKTEEPEKAEETEKTASFGRVKKKRIRK